MGVTFNNFACITFKIVELDTWWVTIQIKVVLLCNDATQIWYLFSIFNTRLLGGKGWSLQQNDPQYSSFRTSKS